MKQAFRFVWVAVLLTAGLTGFSFGAQTNTLDSLQSSYEKAKAAIDSAFDKARTDALSAYSTSLSNSLATLTKAGELDSVLAIKTEKERFEKENAVPEATNLPNPVLAKIVMAYNTSLANAETTQLKDESAMLKNYVKALDSLVKQLTVQSQLEEAVKARDEKTKAEFLLADMETKMPKPPAPVAPPSQVAARQPVDYPAIGGTWKDGKTTIVVTKKQSTDGRWMAVGTYILNSSFGEVRWEASGLITKDGGMSGNLRHTRSPGFKEMFFKGKLSDDMKNITGTFKKGMETIDTRWVRQ